MVNKDPYAIQVLTMDKPSGMPIWYDINLSLLSILLKEEILTLF